VRSAIRIGRRIGGGREVTRVPTSKLAQFAAPAQVCNWHISDISGITPLRPQWEGTADLHGSSNVAMRMQRIERKAERTVECGRARHVAFEFKMGYQQC